MAENYLNIQRPSAFQNFLQGFGAGQGFIGNINQQNAQAIKNQMLQNELTKQEEVKKALANYGQPGFDEAAAVKAVMPFDPELGIKISNLKRTATKEQLELYGAAAKIYHEVAPSLIDNPQAYHLVRTKMNALGMGEFIPPVQTFMTKDGQIDVNRMNETVKRIATGSQLFLEEAKAGLKPDEIKEFKEGDKIVTKRFDRNTRQWVSVAEGPRFNEDAFIVGQTPDGKPYMIKTKGGELGGTLGKLPQFEKDTNKKIEQGLMDQTEILKNINEVRNRFDPKFATYEGTIKGGWVGLKDKAGIGLTRDDADYLHRFTQYRAEAGQMLADRLKAMSGTAVTEPEMKRQEVYMVKAGTGWLDGDSPTQVKAKLDRMQNFTVKAIARLNYFRNNGFSIKNSDDLQKAINATGLSLDKVVPKDIMQKRAIQLRKLGMSPQDTAKTLISEFGIMD